MNFLKELNLVNNYLFCTIFTALSVISSIVGVISLRVWEDLFPFSFIVCVLTGLVDIALNFNLYKKSGAINKIFSILFTFVVILFFWALIKDATRRLF